jgi:hypothetical protein
VALCIETNFFLESVIMGDCVWPGSDQRHLAGKDVEKLRQLVQIAPAEKAADPGNAFIALPRLMKLLAILERGHRAEFENSELALIEAVTPLTEPDRPA